MLLNQNTIRICERCQTRYVTSPDQTDYVHDCSEADSEALRNEDVINLGSAVDFQNTGHETSGGRGSKFEVFYQGIGNQLFGTRADIEDEDFDGVTSRGKRSTTHRTRKHLAYKDLR